MLHVWFPTKYGNRFLDICVWWSKEHYVAARFHPIKCWEVKSGHARYYGSRQHKKDVWIMWRYRFTVTVVWVWGDEIMEWPGD